MRRTELRFRVADANERTGDYADDFEKAESGDDVKEHLSRYLLAF